MAPKNNPATLNPTRRFTVRLALATGATVATLMGSQTLAILEGQKVQTETAPLGETAVSSVNPNTNNNAGSAETPAKSALPPAPPKIVIIRQAGSGETINDNDSDNAGRAVNAPGIGITPPKAVIIKPPAPSVIIQPSDGSAVSVDPVQPAAPQPAPISRSSR